MTTPDDRTEDRFLDGQVVLRQPAHGYRAGMDAVLLAAAIAAKPGESLMEFGCGAGAALICAAWRNPGTYLTGCEIDPAAADLARENVAANGFADCIEVEICDIATLGAGQRGDQVFFNPPFFDDERALRAPRPEKRVAWLSGDAPLKIWIRAAARVLNARGKLTLIHRADRLGDILAALDKSFGSVAIKPVHPRPDRPAKRVIVTARLGGRAPLVLLPPLVMHAEEGHSEQAEAILRGRAGIAMEG
jgi:tRNA1(Val) A37 N6-methylase TrmN6